MQSADDPKGLIREAYRIDGAFPNPFARSTAVRFTVREAQTVRAEVYDLLGRRVQTLLDAPIPANVQQTLRVKGDLLAGGTYVVQFTGETFTASQKVTVLK